MKTVGDDDELNTKCRYKCSLNKKYGKDKYYVIYLQKITIKILDTELEFVDKIKYLNKIINKDGYLIPEIIYAIRSA